MKTLYKRFEVVMIKVAGLREIRLGGKWMTETPNYLSEELLPYLQKETLVLLSTIDFETGAPNVSAISWVYAMDTQTVRFAVDHRSRIVSNVREKAGVVLTFMGNGTVNTVSGEARLITEALEEVPLKLACVEVKIQAVRDAMFYGSRISVEPRYEKTYDKRAAEKLDNQVFSAIKKA
jgi:hypothetical protein